jgi:hypothetical protein
MTSYRDAVASSEFRALLGGRAAGSAAATMQMLAVSVLIYARTGSPLLAALAFAAGSLPQLLAAMTLMASADAVPPRRLLAGWPVLRALAVALLATGALPVWASLAVLLAAGAGDGVPPAAPAPAVRRSARHGITTRRCCPARSPGSSCWPSGCPTG